MIADRVIDTPARRPGCLKSHRDQLRQDPDRITAARAQRPDHDRVQPSSRTRALEADLGPRRRRADRRSSSTSTSKDIKAHYDSVGRASTQGWSRPELPDSLPRDVPRPKRRACGRPGPSGVGRRIKPVAGRENRSTTRSCPTGRTPPPASRRSPGPAAVPLVPHGAEPASGLGETTAGRAARQRPAASALGPQARAAGSSELPVLERVQVGAAGRADRCPCMKSLRGGGVQAVGVGAGEESGRRRSRRTRPRSRWMPAAVSKRSTIASDGFAVWGAHLKTGRSGFRSGSTLISSTTCCAIV